MGPNFEVYRAKLSGVEIQVFIYIYIYIYMTKLSGVESQAKPSQEDQALRHRGPSFEA